MKRLSSLIILTVFLLTTTSFAARFNSIRAIKRAGRSSIGKTATLRVKLTSVYPSPQVSTAITSNGTKVAIVFSKRLSRSLNKIRTGRYYNITGRVHSLSYNGKIKITGFSIR